MRARFVLVTFLVCLCGLTAGCSSITPRYRLSEAIPEPEPAVAALLQIPKAYTLLLFDNAEPTTSVKHDFLSQAVVQHAFRETLVPAGVHTLLFNARVGSYAVVASPFLAALDFQPGHTYRVQVGSRKTTDGVLFYGWVETIPFLLERKKISPGVHFSRQFDYWRNQDWEIAAAGLVLPKDQPITITRDEALELCRERIPEIEQAFPERK